MQTVKVVAQYRMKRGVLLWLLHGDRSSLKTGPARKNTARVFTNLITTDTHELVKL